MMNSTSAPAPSSPNQHALRAPLPDTRDRKRAIRELGNNFLGKRPAEGPLSIGRVVRLKAESSPLDGRVVALSKALFGKYSIDAKTVGVSRNGRRNSPFLDAHDRLSSGLKQLNNPEKPERFKTLVNAASSLGSIGQLKASGNNLYKLRFEHRFYKALILWEIVQFLKAGASLNPDQRVKLKLGPDSAQKQLLTRAQQLLRGNEDDIGYKVGMPPIFAEDKKFRSHYLKMLVDQDLKESQSVIEQYGPLFSKEASVPKSKELKELYKEAILKLSRAVLAKRDESNYKMVAERLKACGRQATEESEKKKFFGDAFDLYNLLYRSQVQENLRKPIYVPVLDMAQKLYTLFCHTTDDIQGWDYKCTYAELLMDPLDSKVLDHNWETIVHHTFTQAGESLSEDSPVRARALNLQAKYLLLKSPTENKVEILNLTKKSLDALVTNHWHSACRVTSYLIRARLFINCKEWKSAEEEIRKGEAIINELTDREKNEMGRRLIDEFAKLPELLSQKMAEPRGHIFRPNPIL